jgi:hypothetical protein
LAGGSQTGNTLNSIGDHNVDSGTSRSPCSG